MHTYKGLRHWRYPISHCVAVHESIRLRGLYHARMLLNWHILGFSFLSFCRPKYNTRWKPPHLYKGTAKRRSRKRSKATQRAKHDLCSLLAVLLKLSLEKTQTPTHAIPLSHEAENKKLKNALQCAGRNRAEKQGDSHHHPSLENAESRGLQRPTEARQNLTSQTRPWKSRNSVGW